VTMAVLVHLFVPIDPNFYYVDNCNMQTYKKYLANIRNIFIIAVTLIFFCNNRHLEGKICLNCRKKDVINFSQKISTKILCCGLCKRKILLG
jgi:hypothetical protein